MTQENRTRSVAKGFSWRFVGTLDTMILAYIFTGEFKAAASIGIAEVITKFILFYFHERIWLKIKWGRQIEKDNYRK